MLWRFGVSASMPFGPASLLGVERFDSDTPLELLPGDDDARKEQIIRAIYRQVLGNAYVMDSERQVVIESQFKLGEISVREFVRRLAKSDLYRTRFFDDCARYRHRTSFPPSVWTRTSRFPRDAHPRRASRQPRL